MGVTFEDLKKANESIKTTDIKGKDYAEVNQRIKAFRMVYPEGCILTDMISNENGVCIFKAAVFANGDLNSQLGVGHAYEKEGSSFINKTSYIENCETSAVGRALAMAGFGIDVSIASAEEVENAQLQQVSESTISDTKATALGKMLSKEKIAVDFVCKLYSVKGLRDLTEAKHNNIVQHIEDIKKKQEENTKNE